MPPHHTAARVQAPAVPLPTDKRLPFGWGAFALPAGGTLVELRFARVPPRRPLRLRLTVALDTREEKLVEVRSARSRQLLGVFDLRFAYALQVFELLLGADAAALLRREGITLRLIKGEQPVWFLTLGAGDAVRLQPHVLIDEPAADPEAAFWQTLGSRGVLQPFGWLEGCVTEGLYDWQQTGSAQARQTLADHLSLYVDESRRLRYEDARSHPTDERIYGVEAPLPLAALARLDAAHPALDLLAAYARAEADADGLIQETTLTTEGCYTLAYPLAVLARLRHDADLARLALVQLERRQAGLVTETTVYQRKSQEGVAAFANWGRGLAWYLLGTVRTLTELGQAGLVSEAQREALLPTFRHTARRVLAAQQANGAWPAYVGEPATGVDTAATAGIAAALALAVRQGWLEAGEVSGPLLKTRQVLLSYLTPDGLLTNACQSNRGGEALQRGGYRVISQYGSGLMAQFLLAQR